MSRSESVTAPPAPSARVGAPPRPAQSFRDHLTTADDEGRRVWLYPRKPDGPLFRARQYFSGVLLLVMFAGPFVRIQGNPLLMLNIVERKFVILGQVFWPQDMAIFAVALLVYMTGIALFTTAYGRLWCGWACPQTVLMEMVFRQIEYFIEGDSLKQKALAAAPWTPRKIALRVFKQAVFLGLSFIIGNTLLSYIIGSDALFQLVLDDPSKHVRGLTFMVLFTLIFYGIFARFREQACTFICPYGRFQSTLMDENSIIVAYDYRRGEQRGHLRRDQSPAQRQAGGQGDCIDCNECVTVCPTGIDIRNGTQMECVHCTACIDACNRVMTRIGRPKGLIRYASLNGIEKGDKLRITPRLVVYTGLLAVLGVLLGVLLLTRSDVETTVLRAPGALFQKMPDGKLSNLYTLKAVNKTGREVAIELKLESPQGQLQVLGRSLVLPPHEMVEASVLIGVEPTRLGSGATPVVIGVYTQDRRLTTVKTAFIGPRDDAL